jgi:hypothetical protein
MVLVLVANRKVRCQSHCQFKSGGGKIKEASGRNIVVSGRIVGGRGSWHWTGADNDSVGFALRSEVDKDECLVPRQKVCEGTSVSEDKIYQHENRPAVFEQSEFDMSFYGR